MIKKSKRGDNLKLDRNTDTGPATRTNMADADAFAASLLGDLLRATALYQLEGLSAQAAWLNENKRLTRHGNLWTAKTLDQVIKRAQKRGVVPKMKGHGFAMTRDDLPG